jgi:ABC-type uncharacterized transport system involved in gliding motility auxiliary subunit
MRTTPPMYKYSGLIAGFGLASLLVGLIILVAVKGLGLAAWIILALGVLLLVTAIVIDFNKVKGAVTGRRSKFSTGNTVMAFVFVGIILLVNAISIQYNARYDITELSQFTLTSQTKEVLTKMDIPVDVICFFTPNDPYGMGLDTYATSLLDEYKTYTDLLTVKVVDPDEHPDEAKKYNISEYQSIVFESEIGSRIVSPLDIVKTSGGQISGIEAENPFTSAILEVTGQVQKKIYFLTGHNEASITGEYSYARQALLDNLFKVETLDLMATQAVPDDCSVLVIAAPRQNFTALEYKIIKDYIDNKGTVFIMVNPGAPDDIKTLISGYYMDIEEGVLIDPSAYYSTMDNPIVPRTQNEFGYTEIYFPGAAAITPSDNYPDDIILAPLFYSSAYSWMERNFDPTVKPEFNESIETLGSRAIGVYMMKQPPETLEDGTIPEGVDYTRIIVVGDSDFASNQHFYNSYNGYQLLSIFEYLTSGEQIISIERKILPYRSLVVTPEEETFIRVASIGLLPLLVIVAGAVIWWRRR